MDGDLLCNHKKCRKPLNGFAWITSCSHIFCDEDGTKQFRSSYSCPACETSLSGKFNILRIDLQPSEQYKSMMLAGQKPETIMEVCSRAMSFWSYQAQQERTYQEYLATKAKERSSQLEQYYEQIINRAQTELSALKSQITVLRKEVDTAKKRYNEVSDKMMEKNRQYQKLQSLYDAMRRRCINPSTFDPDAATTVTPARRSMQASFNMHMIDSDELLHHNPVGSGGDSRSSRMNISPAERDFTLRPAATPVIGTSSGNQDVRQRFNLGLGTPNGQV